MVYPVTPFAGAKPGEKNDGVSSVKLGTTFTGDDGHVYIFAKASDAISASAACVLTEPAMTMASGEGAWTSPAFALVADDTAWFKKTAI